MVRGPGQGGLGPVYLVERADTGQLAAVRLFPTPPSAREPSLRVLSALHEDEASVPILDHGLASDGDLWLALAVAAPAETRDKLRRHALPAAEEARVVEPLAAIFEKVYRRVRARIDQVVPPGGGGRLRGLVTGGYTWRILRPLGQGGIGSVYLGEREEDGWLAAIKFYARLVGAREEAVRETAAMRLADPSTIAVRDAGVTDDGEMWIAVDFVRGEDLRTRLERGPLPAQEAAAIMAQLFRALDRLHGAGVAHGDIKPENLVVEPGGRLRLVDFGRARLHHLYAGEGLFPGTVPYMHPSLFRGGAPDPRTDTFAAWVTLYELVAGERPYGGGTLKAAVSAPLPRPRPLPDPVLDRMVWAGLEGTLRVARPSFVALSRYLRGHADLPRVRSIPPPPSAQHVAWGWEVVRGGRSGTLLGYADDTRAILEAVHREAQRHRWTALWVRADWGTDAAPLSAALGLVGHAADGIDVPALSRIADELGPLGGVLAERIPAARTWVRVARRTGGAQGSTEELLLALRAFVSAAPRPLLVLVDRIDRVDGASRRFLGDLALSGEVPVLASSSPRGGHGLPLDREVPHQTVSLEPTDPPTARHREILARAAVLDLPFDRRLARAIGATEEEVEDAALECEATGAARWNGYAVLARPVHLIADDLARAWMREAARRLDPAEDPLLVASYARRAGDLERLVEVIDAAVREALAREPEAALRLMDEDPRPRTPEVVLRHFHVAVLARRTQRADELLAELRALPDVGAADLAEAEGELAFRAGKVVPALAAYRTAAAALGRPVGTGLRMGFEFARALWRMWADRPAPPRPDARLGRIFERLHDLQFTHDHAPMLRVHELWREAAPDHPRARAMEVVWRTALGWNARALACEEALLRAMDEAADPVGYAVVLLHRAIARCWRGETTASLADAIDAASALTRIGDPYLAALCNTTITMTAVHLGEPERLQASIRKTARIAEVVGDARGSAWVAGGQAAWHWLVGDHPGALRVARAWAEDAQRRDDSSEAVARRLLVELYAEVGEHAAALAEAARAATIVRTYHLQMDFTSAWVIGALVADAQARRAGARGLGPVGRRLAAWRMGQVVARSPRWTPRAMAARAWQAVADGQEERAMELFGAAARDAQARGQAHDEWIVLDGQARALGDARARAAADAVARRAGLKQGAAHVP